LIQRKVNLKMGTKPLLSTFLIELVYRLKTHLAHKEVSLISPDKFDDKEFRKQSLTEVSEDIKKIILC